MQPGDGAQFMANQQAGKIVRLRTGSQLPGQAERSRAENGRQRPRGARVRQGNRQAAVKRLLVERLGRLHGASENGVGAERGVDLAGHEGIEVNDAPALYLHPFGVAAR